MNKVDNTMGSNTFFRKLDPDLRKIMASYALECRKRDRGGKTTEIMWYSQERTLDEYCHRLGIIRAYLDTLIQLKMAHQNKTFFLDIGVGRGEVVKEILRLYGEAIHCFGVGLTPKSFAVSGDYDHLIGFIEEIDLPREKFDFIFSVRGGFSYTLNSFAAAQTTLNSLKTEGVFFLEERRLLFPQEWFSNFLNQNGFVVEVTRYEDGEPVSFKIIRKDDSFLDLSKLNERYIVLLNDHKPVFLKWGLDRLREGSPLNSLFQDLYSEANYSDLIKIMDSSNESSSRPTSDDRG